MTKTVRTLTENTWIPLGTAVLVIGGGAYWLANIHLATASNTISLNDLNPKIEQIQKDIAEIKGELKRIKGP